MLAFRSTTYLVQGCPVDSKIRVKGLWGSGVELGIGFSVEMLELRVWIWRCRVTGFRVQGI